MSTFSVGVLLVDFRHNDREITRLMRRVWLRTTACSGLHGLAVYFFSGRKQIPQDSLWRRAFRSVAHCHSGCGAGEIVRLMFPVGILGLKSTATVAIVTFGFAYAFGIAPTCCLFLSDRWSLFRSTQGSLGSA